jgi:hypothetical protein
VAMPASFPQSKAAVLANSLMFFNSGNMGLPLIMLTFRDSQFLDPDNCDDHSDDLLTDTRILHC